MNIPDLIRVAGNYIRTSTTTAFDNNDLTFDVYDPTKIESEGGLLEVQYDVPHKREVVYVVSKSGNTLTIADDGRGLYGTNAQDHPANSKVRDFFVSDHINQFTSTVLGIIYPIGSIYISTNSSLPTYISALGTWTTFGAGRVLVGRDSGDTDFDTAEETGGQKTTRHAYPITALNSSQFQDPGAAYWTSVRGDINSYLTGGGSSSVSSQTAVRGVGGTGGTTGTGNTEVTHDRYTATNLQPYVVVYMWKRTA
ncbi:MAG TPA: hypothetical protein PK863_01990 [Candidatus Dojkabacteria bacterium]|nr:hypothetical protein [Candidatus Dojkabacteria bacterium]HRP50769.1 hypothetical protein [Candidatus Dojkabacteria bacterium]